MRLVVEQGAAAGQIFALEWPAVVVGRGGETTGERFALPEPNASRQHARFERGSQGWLLIDLGSTNGTYLNRQPIRPHQPHLLRPGDRVVIGGAVLLVDDAGAADAAVPDLPFEEEIEAPARKPHPALLAAGAAALILVLVGIILVLVLVLQPRPEATATPTEADSQEQIMTVVPTEFQEAATAILPLIPTDLPLPLFGPTPTPESVLPDQGLVGVPKPALRPCALAEGVSVRR
jgi:hypothetical protein